MQLTEIHQSHLNMFLRCARQFAFRYVEDLIIPPGIAARRGSATHKAAEKNHISKKKTGADLPADELVDTATDEYKRLIENKGVFISKEKASDKSEQDRLIAEGLDQTVGATRLYADVIAPKIEPDLIEEEIVAQLDGWDLPIGGILDVTDPRGNIMDLKTMKTKSQFWADRELQPIFYSLLYKNLTGKWPAAFKYELMVPNKTPKHIELITQRKPEDLKRIEAIAEVMLKCLETGLFPPAHPSDWICSPAYCGFFNQCPHGK